MISSDPFDLNSALAKLNENPRSLGAYHEFIPAAIENLQIEPAFMAIEAALSIDETNLDTWLLIATALEERNDLQGAVAVYEQLIAKAPSRAQYKYQLGLALFGLGRYEDALPYFVYRAGIEDSDLADRAPFYDANKAPAELFLIEEQGIGDQIMFLQFLPLITEVCEKLTVQVDERLIPLYTPAFPNVSFVGRTVAPRDTSEIKMPIGDLFTLGVPSISKGIFRPNSLQKLWGSSATAERSSEKCKIGISWKTMARLGARKRTIKLSALLAKLDPQLHELVLIQYYAFDQEISLIKDLGFDVETIEDAFGDITSVADAITRCDAVITIDNYLIHLAGALGVRTLGLLPFYPSYRWALDIDVSPIYESVSLARQAAYNEWDLPLEAIAPFLDQCTTS